MNQLSYNVDDKKLKKIGLRLDSSIVKDVKENTRTF